MAKEIKLWTLVLYGVGIILGAGIYSLVGVGASLAGTMLWLAFIIAMLIAVFTGMSYVELSSIFPKAAAEYVYTRNAFRNETLSFMLSWLLMISSVISAAVVALAFGGYLAFVIGGNPTTFALALIALLSVLNYMGIKESAIFNNVSSVIEASGLVLVILLALFFHARAAQSPNFLQMPETGINGIFYAVGVIYFAFIGFEYLANISEDVKDAKKLIPKALIISLAIASLLYILLSITIFMLASPSTLAASKAPLTSAVQQVLPNAALIISIIALFATSNTVLIILIGASRIVYGVSRNKSLPSFLSKMSKRDTPHFAVAFVGAAAMLASLSGNILEVAQLTNLGVFITYFFVNISLLKLRGYDAKDKLVTPRVHGVPIFAVLGAISAVIMSLYFSIAIWLVEFGILLLGLLTFRLYAYRRSMRPKAH